MKKLIIFIMFVMFGVGSLTAQTITVELDEFPAPGAQITVPITVTAIDEGILTFQMYVQFDPAVLTYVSTAYNNAQFPQIEWVTGVNPAGDEWGANWFGADFAPEFLTAPSVLCEITFDYLGGDTPLTWGLTDGGAPVKGQTLFFDPAFGTFTATLVDGCVAGSCPPAMASWTGAVDGDWFNTGNWDTGMVPDAATDVTVPFTNNDPYVYAGEAMCNSLAVDAGVMFGIAADGALWVEAAAVVDGMLFVESDAMGASGSFVEHGLSGTGAFEFWRTIEAYDPLNDHLGWHYLSSPVANFDNWQLPNYFVSKWDEANEMFVPMVGAEPCVPAPQEFMGDMEAWSIKEDYDFACPGGIGNTIIYYAPAMADVHSGPYSGSYTNSGAGMYNGYTLLGNPYPSYIDMAAFAGLSVHIWDGSADDYLDWAGGGDFTEIPPTQGFFVFSATGGMLNLDNVNRLNGTAAFEKAAMDMLTLQVSGNEKSDKTYIRFSDEATPGFDAGMDANKLLAGGTAPQIYTSTPQGMFSINTLQETASVPMGFTVDYAGEYNIEAIQADGYANVVLEDKLTGEQTDLLMNAYSFEHFIGADPERFILHFTPMGTPELEANSIDIWSTDKKIFVQAPEINGDIVVYNMMGQEVVRAEIEPGLNTIPMNEVNAYFVVKVLTSSNAVTGKVFVK